MSFQTNNICFKINTAVSLKVLGKISSDAVYVFLTVLFSSSDWKMVNEFTPLQKKRLCLHNEGAHYFVREA